MNLLIFIYAIYCFYIDQLSTQDIQVEGNSNVILLLRDLKSVCDGNGTCSLNLTQTIKQTYKKLAIDQPSHPHLFGIYDYKNCSSCVISRINQTISMLKGSILIVDIELVSTSDYEIKISSKKFRLTHESMHNSLDNLSNRIGIKAFTVICGKDSLRSYLKRNMKFNKNDIVNCTDSSEISDVQILNLYELSSIKCGKCVDILSVEINKSTLFKMGTYFNLLVNSINWYTKKYQYSSDEMCTYTCPKTTTDSTMTPIITSNSDSDHVVVSDVITKPSNNRKFTEKPVTTPEYAIKTSKIEEVVSTVSTQGPDYGLFDQSNWSINNDSSQSEMLDDVNETMYLKNTTFGYDEDRILFAGKASINGNAYIYCLFSLIVILLN